MSLIKIKTYFLAITACSALTFTEIDPANNAAWNMSIDGEDSFIFRMKGTSYVGFEFFDNSGRQV